MNILVTGGRGYIGAAIVNKLTKMPKIKRITVIDNKSTGHRINSDAKINYVDYTLGSFKGLTYEADMIIHCAGDVKTRELEGMPLAGVFNNNLATYELLQANKNHAPIIFASTGAVYGNAVRKRGAIENDDKDPFSVNAKTKLFAEQMIEWYYGLKKYLIFRIYNVVGMSGTVFSSASNIEFLSMKCASSGDVFEIKGRLFPTEDGTAVKDYIGLDDVVRAFVKGIDYLKRKDAGPQIINIGSGEDTSVEDFLIGIEDIAGKKIFTRKTPEDASTPFWVVADISQANEIIKWKPTKTLKENLEQVWKFKYGSRG